MTMLAVLLHAHIVHVAVLAAGQPKGANGLPNPGADAGARPCRAR